MTTARAILIGAALLAAAIYLGSGMPASTPPPATAGTTTPTPIFVVQPDNATGYAWRLNTQTGAMALCSSNGTCTSMAAPSSAGTTFAVQRDNATGYAWRLDTQTG